MGGLLKGWHGSEAWLSPPYFVRTGPSPTGRKLLSCFFQPDCLPTSDAALSWVVHTSQELKSESLAREISRCAAQAHSRTDLHQKVFGAEVLKRRRKEDRSRAAELVSIVGPMVTLRKPRLSRSCSCPRLVP